MSDERTEATHPSLGDRLAASEDARIETDAEFAASENAKLREELAYWKNQYADRLAEIAHLRDQCCIHVPQLRAELAAANARIVELRDE